jgi:hypothetical protein
VAKIFTKDFFNNLLTVIAKDIEKKDYDKALGNIEIALKMKAIPELFYDLTLAYKAKNMLPEALEAIEKAINMQPRKEYLKAKTDLNYLLRIQTVRTDVSRGFRTREIKSEGSELIKATKAWGEIWDEHPGKIEHFYTFCLQGKETEAQKALKELLVSYFEGDELHYNFEKLYKLPIPKALVKKLAERAFKIADYQPAAAGFYYLSSLNPQEKESYKLYLDDPELKAVAAKYAQVFNPGEAVYHKITKYTGQIISFNRDLELYEIVTNKKEADSKLYSQKLPAHGINLKKITELQLGNCWNCFEMESEFTNIICLGPHVHSKLKEKCFICNTCGAKSHEHLLFR